MTFILDNDEFLSSTIIKLIKRGAITNLKNIIDKTHSADLSKVCPRLTPDEKITYFTVLIENKRMGQVLSEMNREDRKFFVDVTEEKELIDTFRAMPADDVSEVLAELPKIRSEEILRQISGKGSENVEQMLKYDEKTAGYIMTPNFFSIHEDVTASIATDRVREMADVEMVFYVYVVDSENRLQGVISLRQLVATKHDTPLKELMIRRIYKVYPHTPQEEVARVVSRYNILAVPVVDSDDGILGIVTIDDVVDVIREENTEDILKMAGTGAVDLASKSIFRNARARLPWLSASWLGGVIAATVIGGFHAQLEKVAALTAFIPIIMGMGGNIGTQSATIIVRGLATGEVDLKYTWSVLRREFSTGIILGGVYGILLGLFAKVRFWSVSIDDAEFLWQLPVVVGVAICFNMMMSATVGTFFPMLFKRMQIDPAIATGPFVTTSIDIFGILAYFMIADFLLF